MIPLVYLPFIIALLIFVVNLPFVYDEAKSFLRSGTPVYVGSIVSSVIAPVGVILVYEIEGEQILSPLVVFLATAVTTFVITRIVWSMGERNMEPPPRPSQPERRHESAEKKREVVEPEEKISAIKIPLTKEGAEGLALLRLRGMFPGEGDKEIVILTDQTIEKPYGYIIFWSDQLYERTRDPEYTLLGANPFFVEKLSGKMEVVSLVDISVEDFFIRYERKLGIRAPK